jgi:ElaB/YqjD/DUF883 family membrane-anchored ribosome-binding protein
MKNKNLLLALLSLAAFAVACEPSDKPSAEATAKQFDKVKAETKDAAEDLKDYTYAQKSTFVEKMQVQLANINRDLDELAAKIEKSSDTTKAEAKPKLQALRDKAGTLNQQLDKAKNATESTWEDVKAGSRKIYAELKDGFAQSRQWVSDKIAP